MRLSLTGFALMCHAIGSSQTMNVSVKDPINMPDSTADPEMLALYEFLDVDRYLVEFDMPDTGKHEVLLVMRSIDTAGVRGVDTLLNTAPWRKKVVGGFPWDPNDAAEFMVQRKDSVHYRVRGQMGMGFSRTLTAAWPNHGYRMEEGIGSYGEPVPIELGEPFPVMVLSQPYPDPPAPAKPVIYRFCFGGGIPPEQWPERFGVPHLYLFELTVLP